MVDVKVDRDLLDEVIASFELLEEDAYDHGGHQLRVWRSRWAYLEHSIRKLKEAVSKPKIQVY